MFEQEAKEARRVRGEDQLLYDSDDSSDDDENDDMRADGCASAERDDETDENLFLSIGDFKVPPGWEALERP